jgi:hypothetical protein
MADSTSHEHGCAWPGCEEFARTRVDVWDTASAVGWYQVGAFCPKHASECAVSLIDHDVRKVPING